MSEYPAYLLPPAANVARPRQNVRRVVLKRRILRIKGGLNALKGHSVVNSGECVIGKIIIEVKPLSVKLFTLIFLYHGNSDDVV